MGKSSRKETGGRRKETGGSMEEAGYRNSWQEAGGQDVRGRMVETEEGKQEAGDRRQEAAKGRDRRMEAEGSKGKRQEIGEWKHLSVCLSAFLSVCLFVCLTVCHEAGGRKKGQDGRGRRQKNAGFAL
jgi:hypothetical protein